jgi:hemerythrin-like metal-binding protein
MPLINWTNQLSIGIAAVDSQHQRLVELVNSLFDSLSAGNASTVMPEIKQELIKYTKIHFRFEEELMQRNGYPKIDEHKAEHNKLVSEVEIMEKKFKSGNSELVKFLKQWLVEHIKLADKEYGDYIVGLKAQDSQ